MTTMQSQEGASANKEYAFLGRLFEMLSKFLHDKAKDSIDKERELMKNRASLLWSSFMNMLGQLVTHEKSFYSLAFLNQNLGARLIGRKDVLITSYNCMLMEFKKIENALLEEKSVSSQSTGASLDQLSTDSARSGDETLKQLIVSMCEDLHHYCSARIGAIRFYEQLLAIGSSKQVGYAYDEVIGMMLNISQRFQNSIRHPLLATMKSNFLLESDIIIQLLQCHVDIQNYRFLPSLSRIKDVKYKLDTLANLSSETRRSLGPGSRSHTTELNSWFISYKNALYSKFSLYFYEMFSKQVTQQEMKATLCKTSIDYYNKISSFHKKADVHCVCFVLNTNELTEDYKGPGYHLPSVLCGAPTPRPNGLDSYPAIFSYPQQERPSKHWPTVVSLLTDRALDLSVADKAVFDYDEKINASYFMIQCDPLITLILIYETKKLAKDNAILNFLTNIATELRCARVFLSLKPGSK